jgi:uroporphyrin-III C-methyltransferase/precorrin-2 dehydrogenase/sirohydrochlorin ferrochelatase
VLARAEGTLVFYMSVGALDSITASLTSLGRDPREPAILVEQAGVAGERVIAARLARPGARARRRGPCSSAHRLPRILLIVRRVSSHVSV